MGLAGLAGGAPPASAGGQKKEMSPPYSAAAGAGSLKRPLDGGDEGVGSMKKHRQDGGGMEYDHQQQGEP